MRRLTDCVEAYEQAMADGRPCAIESFLPDEAHPDYREIVIELVRVEMEHKGWQRESSIRHYCQRFARVFADAESRSRIAFEEFRVRRQHGDSVSRRQYADDFCIDTSRWRSVALGTCGPDDWYSASATGGTSADDSARHGSVSGQDSSRRTETPRGELSPGTAPRRSPRSRVMKMGIDELRQYIVQSFPEFEPLEELGQGAFGRVFLARQKNLADRLVVIKVTSDTTAEPERLARLQHTNIVPVYSVHRSAEWQAICMPYFGRQTLRNLLGSGVAEVSSGGPGLKAVPIPDANTCPAFLTPAWVAKCLRLVEQVALGLEHAHRNGILHRDVKPANILVTDGGEAMLLDFNLSSDIVTQTLSRSIVGGTIPYLAPEQLESLQTGTTVTVAADVYSLGVILFETLTGRLPFQPTPAASLSELVHEAQSRTPLSVPDVRAFSPQCSVAVQTIIRKCLQPDPADRYRSAADLAEDLNCELNSQPLKFAGNRSIVERIAKWRRRHPRVLSVGSLLAALVVVISLAGGGWAVIRQRMDTLHAQSQWQKFKETVPVVRTLLSSPVSSPIVLEEGVASARALLDQYRVPVRADWRTSPDYNELTNTQQKLLDEELSEVVFLMSSAIHRQARLTTNERNRESLLEEAWRWNSLASRFESTEKSRQAWLLQRTAIEVTQGRIRGDVDPGRELISSESGELSGFAVAIQLLEEGQSDAAHRLLMELVQANPHDYSAWYLLGQARQMSNRNWEADAAFSTCIALNPNCWLAWQDRGIVRLRLRQFQAAADDCSESIRRRPDIAANYLNRALAKIAVGEFSAAELDLNESIDRDGPTRAWFLRAEVRGHLGNQAAAILDLEHGLSVEPNDEDSWVARGMAWLPQDAERALADFEHVLRFHPQSRDALQNSAHVLSERLGRPGEAIRRLDDLLLSFPDDNAARIGRAVLRARLRNDQGAREDALQVLAASPDPVTVYQVACVFSLLSERTAADSEAAMLHLTNALRVDPGLYAMAELDADLNPVRGQAAFLTLLGACRTLVNPAMDVSQVKNLSPGVSQFDGNDLK